MQFLKVLIAITIVFSGLPVSAAEPVSAAKTVDTWDTSVCKQTTKAACLIAKSWHWLRQEKLAIDPGIQVMAGAGVGWTTALVARWVVGSTPGIEFLATVSRTGVQAGMILVGTGVVVAVMGAFVSAAGFLFASVTPAGGPGDEISSYCQQMLAPYQTPEGLKKLTELPPEEFKKLLPCIPQNPGLSGLLMQGYQNGSQLEQQLKPN